MSATPAKADKSDASSVPPQKLDPVAGILSYLIPGLGQIVQGRVVKGIVFFVSLYALFFYGMVLGKCRNVYIPDTAENSGVGTRLLHDLYNRPHFAGQFFIGVAAWPAIIQYWMYDPKQDRTPLFGKYMRSPRITQTANGFTSEEINDLQRSENKTFDLGWVYTVIAGVLNILVIYDAVAGPAFREAMVKENDSSKPQQTVTA